MKKRKSHAFGKDVYLLGADSEGTLYWLEEPVWDCNWYWGFGYIETYTNNRNPGNSSDIESHEHFDGLKNIGNQRTNLHTGFLKKFTETPLTDSEIWQLCELMESYYICRDYSDFIFCTGAHYTGNNPVKDLIKNTTEYDRINQAVLPEIFNEVRKILDPESEVSTSYVDGNR